MTARRATARVCSARPELGRRPADARGERSLNGHDGASACREPAAGAGACSARGLARALELAAGLGEEHVVERGLVELERLHLAGRPGRARGRSRPAGPRRRAAARSRCRGRCARSSPKPRQQLGQPVARLRVGRRHLDGRAADLGLQLRRRALGDDPAVVDDPDPVGQRRRPPPGTGSSGRRSCPRRGRAARPPPTAPRGSAGQGRWSARRGTGSAASGRAPARGRAGASSRPSSRRPGGRPLR